MEEFDFDYHIPTTEYPESGDRLQFGGSYTFSSAPTSPDQRIITLHFQEMRNYVDKTTGVVDVLTNPKSNFYRLELFYQRHRLWKSFNYRHPQYGMLVVRFSKPLKTPKKQEGFNGILEGFTVELMEQP